MNVSNLTSCDGSSVDFDFDKSARLLADQVRLGRCYGTIVLTQAIFDVTRLHAASRREVSRMINDELILRKLNAFYQCGLNTSFVEPTCFRSRVFFCYPELASSRHLASIGRHLVPPDYIRESFIRGVN